MKTGPIHPLEYHAFPDLPAEVVEACESANKDGQQAEIWKKDDGTFSIVFAPQFDADFLTD